MSAPLGHAASAFKESRADQLKQSRRRTYASLQRLLNSSCLTPEQKAALQRRFDDQDARYKRLHKDAENLTDIVTIDTCTKTVSERPCSQNAMDHDSTTTDAQPNAPLIASFYTSVLVASLTKAHDLLKATLELLNTADALSEDLMDELRQSYTDLARQLNAYGDDNPKPPIAPNPYSILFDCRLLASDCDTFLRKVHLEAAKHEMRKQLEEDRGIPGLAAELRRKELAGEL